MGVVLPKIAPSMARPTLGFLTMGTCEMSHDSLGVKGCEVARRMVLLRKSN